MRRIVARVERSQVARLDALLEHFSDSSRASLIRAFITLGLGLAEADVEEGAKTQGEACGAANAARVGNDEEPAAAGCGVQTINHQEVER